MDTLGGRKFIFGLIITFMGFGLVIGKYIDVQFFFNFINIVFATYIVGNVGESVSNKMGTGNGK